MGRLPLAEKRASLAGFGRVETGGTPRQTAVRVGTTRWYETGDTAAHFQLGLGLPLADLFLAQHPP